VPELPEVETVVRDLRPLLVGRCFVAVLRLSRRALRKPWKAGWVGRLTGRRVESVERRGKWIVLGLEAGHALVVHLGMTGQLTVTPAGAPAEPHTHLAFDLAGEGALQLRFRDVRRFGSVTLLRTPGEQARFFAAAGLGPEPFDLEAGDWRRRLAATARPVKSVLLDQQVVAGVGNIYADESLFQARLHPTRPARDLAPAEADRLRKAVAAVLRRAIARRGSSIRDYVGGSGERGGYQQEFRVYGRTGRPCPRCGSAIASLRLAGRSTHYCPTCQS
jgi:formamidopyrimidine-DNA glycosylase